ncbi:MAG TPA: hypothetical protein VII38_22090, partial [Polyangia bacterium]
MATRKKDQKPAVSDGRDRPPTRFELWWEEAWEGWIKSIAAVVLLAVAYLFYKFDLVGEHFAGVLVVLLIIGGSVISLAVPAWPVIKTRSPSVRALFLTMLAVSIVATAWPCLRLAAPPSPIAEAHLQTGALSETVKTGAVGPYEVTVSGHFKKAGMQEAEGSYTVKATSGQDTEEIDGTLKRTLVR